MSPQVVAVPIAVVSPYAYESANHMTAAAGSFTIIDALPTRLARPNIRLLHHAPKTHWRKVILLFKMNNLRITFVIHHSSIIRAVPSRFSVLRFLQGSLHDSEGPRVRYRCAHNDCVGMCGWRLEFLESCPCRQ